MDTTSGSSKGSPANASGLSPYPQGLNQQGRYGVSAQRADPSGALFEARARRDEQGGKPGSAGRLEAQVLVHQRLAQLHTIARRHPSIRGNASTTGMRRLIVLDPVDQVPIDKDRALRVVLHPVVVKRVELTEMTE